MLTIHVHLQGLRYSRIRAVPAAAPLGHAYSMTIFFALAAIFIDHISIDHQNKPNWMHNCLVYLFLSVHSFIYLLFWSYIFVASIDISFLCADGDEKVWKPNLNEFKNRFDPTITNGEGTARLKNLYFIYLIELRAISKVR